MTSLTGLAGRPVDHAVDRTAGESWREQKKRLTRRALHDAARRRVLGQGLASVTVEEICGEAGVSPRTFFNYFPSKSAAALGLPDLTIEDEDRDRFLSARGNPMRDLCHLVAGVVDRTGGSMPDKAALHDLVEARPEVRPELHTWLADVRQRFLVLAEQRLPQSTVRLALALVLTALGDAVESRAESDEHLADRLWSRLEDMAALVQAPAPA